MNIPDTPAEVCHCIREVTRWDTLRRGLNGNGWGETRCAECGRHLYWGMTGKPLTAPAWKMACGD